MEPEIGWVTQYDSHNHRAMLMLKRLLKVGDKIHIHGQEIDFIQPVTSIEINHASVLWAQPGDHVALSVLEPVYPNDKVYRVPREKPELPAS